MAEHAFGAGFSEGFDVESASAPGVTEVIAPSDGQGFPSSTDIDAEYQGTAAADERVTQLRLLDPTSPLEAVTYEPAGVTLSSADVQTASYKFAAGGADNWCVVPGLYDDGGGEEQVLWTGWGDGLGANHSGSKYTDTGGNRSSFGLSRITGPWTSFTEASNMTNFRGGESPEFGSGGSAGELFDGKSYGIAEYEGNLYIMGTPFNGVSGYRGTRFMRFDVNDPTSSVVMDATNEFLPGISTNWNSLVANGNTYKPIKASFVTGRPASDTYWYFTWHECSDSANLQIQSDGACYLSRVLKPVGTSVAQLNAPLDFQTHEWLKTAGATPDWSTLSFINGNEPRASIHDTPLIVSGGNGWAHSTQWLDKLGCYLRITDHFPGVGSSTDVGHGCLQFWYKTGTLDDGGAWTNFFEFDEGGRIGAAQSWDGNMFYANICHGWSDTAAFPEAGDWVLFMTGVNDDGSPDSPTESGNDCWKACPVSFTYSFPEHSPSETFNEGVLGDGSYQRRSEMTDTAGAVTLSTTIQFSVGTTDVDIVEGGISLSGDSCAIQAASPVPIDVAEGGLTLTGDSCAIGTLDGPLLAIIEGGLSLSGDTCSVTAVAAGPTIPGDIAVESGTWTLRSPSGDSGVVADHVVVLGDGTLELRAEGVLVASRVMADWYSVYRAR